MQNCYIEDSLGNSLKIHDNADVACPFFLSDIAGLEYPEIRTGQFNNAGSDGINITSQYTGERRVQLDGRVFGLTTPAAFTTLRQSLFKALAPRYDSTGVLANKWLRFTAMDGNTYRLTGQVIAATAPIDIITSSHFVIDFLANTATIDAYTASNATLGIVVLGGFVLPVVLPIVFTSDSSSQVTVINNGDSVAWPTLTLTGPLTNPRITDITTGQVMALSLTIPTGASVVIDMLNKTIVQGGVTNQMSAKTSDSVFFGLKSGSQILQLSTSNSSDTGNVTLTWRDAYIGI